MKIKTFISTKPDLLDKKVNEWLESIEDEYEILGIFPMCCYGGSCMVGCQITFNKVIFKWEEDDDEGIVADCPNSCPDLSISDYIRIFCNEEETSGGSSSR